MTSPNSESARIDQLFTTLRSTLDQARAAGTAPPPDTDVEPVQGRTDPDGGQVQVVVSANRLVELTLDPRVKRLDAEDLAAVILKAVNDAFTDLGENAKAAAEEIDVDPDTEALGAKLDRLQDASVRQMAMFEQSMAEVVAKLMGGR
ncbi:YbaB/EbfC family nucleoid-associated protein [Phytomonospora endophytica]|uniref:YbaB/EbfC DNA-binding family protein n=1 Tax=Phytomonospora endophytica TaxID=714109 RepID=A0A841G058_9ACTN|nr:YbaB/EbfC family nucleoid-associated protein [Phytomonospora endophytica]MBB6037550.1 hypothetical protein [Phytomonospora endophytica]GIG70251.1 hypothetical protein Pen01_65460 [Phytomonospora endophytica]